MLHHSIVSAPNDSFGTAVFPEPHAAAMITFSISRTDDDSRPVGEFSPSGEDASLRDEARALAERLSAGATVEDRAAVVARLSAMNAAHPGNPYVAGALGDAICDDEPLAAFRVFHTAAQAMLSLIPAEFAGVAPYRLPDNRAVLACLFARGLGARAPANPREASAALTVLMRLDPNDTFDVRHLLGRVLMRDGRHEEALRFMKRWDVGDYVAFDAGLAAFAVASTDHDAPIDAFADAVTFLRRGIAANARIGRMLLGDVEAQAYDEHLASNRAAASTARAYVAQSGGLWRETPGAITFLRWLFNTPEVLRERGQVTEFGAMRFYNELGAPPADQAYADDITPWSSQVLLKRRAKLNRLPWRVCEDLPSAL